jgi:hypothetical protein
MRGLSIEEAIGRRGSGRLVVSMLVGVLAGVACLLAAPSLASAGTFTALSCHGPSGSGIGTYGWAVGTPTGEYITYGDGCAGGGAGSFGLTMGPDPESGHNYVNGDGNAIKYSVPAGLQILSYSLRLEAYGGPCAIQSGQCANGMGDVYVNHTGESDPTYDYRNIGEGSATPTVGAGELSGVNWVVFGVGCDPGQASYYECPGSNSPGFEAQALVSSGSFTLLDSTVPSVTNVSGSLIAGGTLTGTETISFKASDSGGGIYSATVLVDGHQVEQKVPNTNGGLCVDLAPGSSPTMAFAAPQPCPATENVSMSLDTTKLSAGRHQLQVVVTDAAGDEAPAYEGTITVAGSPGSGGGSTGGSTGGSGGLSTPIGSGSPLPSVGPDSPAAVRGPANGANASDQATLTARWASTAKEMCTSGYGAADRITGRLTAPGGVPISGASIEVFQTPAEQGAQARLSDTGVRTGPTGEWTLTLPRDVSSSTLRFAYLSHLDDTIPAATATLTLRVRAGIALRIVPRVTSVGRKIFFSGVLHGTPIPEGGKQLVLEASSGGEWIQFNTISTNAMGHYRASYRFKFPGPITYRFRVVSRHEADFPFLAGASNVVGVHER